VAESKYKGPDPRDTSGGQFPTVEIAGKLFYLDYRNNPHRTQQEAIEANAAIEIAAGRQPCQQEQVESKTE
jgi:hypothetical protein